MEWKVLQEHFRAATRRQPAPFGEHVIEWDYSRYARALGLAGQPGAHELPHTGCAIVSTAAARWEVAERKYRVWATERGYHAWRISARPTVKAPDPVVYALGRRVAGDDGFVFARSGRQGPPALGPRPRSPGCSLPLAPGERWLMATDRVRRRLRNEMAVRGLLLFIDEAHKLTPAALALLLHLLDAHRAWQARMLSRDARVYVVLVTTPEHETTVERALRRFHLKGNIPVGREREERDGTEAAESPASAASRLLDVEEEHLLAALAWAPLAPTRDDVAALFGRSALAVAARLEERDHVCRRIEEGEICYVPAPAGIDGLAPPPPRVLRALRDRYRKRLARGRGHLVFAVAALSFRLGEPHRGASRLGGAPHAAATTVSLDLFAELDQALEPLRDRLHGAHLAVWFALRAHARDYEGARALAFAMTACDLKSWRELRRVLTQVLCVGRAHLDAALPDEFWPALRSERLAGPLMDAACVHAELFWKLRQLMPAQIEERYRFADSCMRMALAEGRTSDAGVHRFVEIMALRVFAILRYLGDPATSRPTFVDTDVLPERLRDHPVPAYLSAAAIYGYIVAPQSVTGFGSRDLALAFDLATSTGNPLDTRMLLNAWCSRLGVHRVRMLLRHGFDESVLVLATSSSPQTKLAFYTYVQSMTGSRAWLIGASVFLARRSSKTRTHNDDFASIQRAMGLRLAGDLAEARECLQAVAPPELPGARALLLSVRMQVAASALSWEELAGLCAEARREPLPEPYATHLTAYARAFRRLTRLDLEGAASRFRTAHECLGPVVSGSRGQMKMNALFNLECTERLKRRFQKTAPEHSGGRAMLDAIESVLAVTYDPAEPRRGWDRASTSMEYVTVALEAWAAARPDEPADDEETIRAALYLRGAVGRALRAYGRDLLPAFLEVAPAFFGKLARALRRRVGPLAPGSPSPAEVGRVLTSAEPLYGRAAPAGRGRGTAIRLLPGCSRSRLAKGVQPLWWEDASVLAGLAASEPVVARRTGRLRLKGYGHVGRELVGPIDMDFELRFKRSGVCEVRRPAAAGVAGAGEPARACRRPRRAKPDGFLGSSPAAAEVRRMIALAAECDHPALILGETGVGKELVARSIHLASKRAAKELVVADCATTVDSLLESEIFGHERGAFTGAHASRAGVFERADGSTLFLDEVDSMSRRMQAALLRVLETGEYRRVGGGKHRRSDFRLVAASLPRLERMRDEGRFRDDLYYRLAALRIVVPPLRERPGDAVEIAKAHARGLGVRLTASGCRPIERYAWPGNVRQLIHAIDLARIHASDHRLGEAAVSEAIATYQGRLPAPPSAARGLESAWSRALRALEGATRFGAWEFARLANVSRRSAQRYLARLLKEGRVERVGAGRATKYRVTPPDDEE